jgi:serine/threonine protein kinase
MSNSANTLPENHALKTCDISSVLGEGGFGIVYRAWDRQLERFIAVKEYMPSALAVRGGDHRVLVKSKNSAETFEAGRRSFLNEARMVARFDHPSVVKIYQFWEENDTAYIAMPLYAGKTLRDVLRERTGSPDEAWIKALLKPLLDALNLIHTHQCYHRDIAPDNIIILEDGSPVLIDFGAARRVIGDMTQALTAVLKPGFAPIEQYADTNAVAQGAWTDVYALSAVTHYVLTGKAPPTSVARVMSESYEPLERRLAGQYSQGFLNALDQGLAIAPEKRPQSAAEFRTLLFRQEGDQESAISASGYITQIVQPIAMTVQTVIEPPPEPPTLQLQKTAAPVATTVNKKKSLGSIALAVGATVAIALAFNAFKSTPPSEVSNAAAPTGVPVTTTKPAVPVVAPIEMAPQSPTISKGALLTTADFYNFLRTRSDPGKAVQVRMSKSNFLIAKDRVSFELSSATDGFVYIFLINSEDKAQLVFPNTSETKNVLNAGIKLTLPRNNNFVASAPIGKSTAIIVLSSVKRSFDEILVYPRDEFPEISLTKLNQLARAGQEAKMLGVGQCANSAKNCEQISVARIEFETNQ